MNGNPTSLQQLQLLIEADENERAEFKRAERRYDFEDLVKYCVALANEGGGNVVLGVTNDRPRVVVGTEAFNPPGRTAAGLHQRLGRRISIDELMYAGKRVLVVRIPSRSVGEAWNDRGTYWERAGDALVPMGDERLRAIHAEQRPDFSAQVCEEARLSDLDSVAVETFRTQWHRRAPALRVSTWPVEELLQNAELLHDGRLTYASLILLGRQAALRRYLPNAELIFEYRSQEGAGPAQDRSEARDGFLLVQEGLWGRINTRNDKQSIQDGFFRLDVPTFDEAVIREAILNAVAHRDYREEGSIFITQFPRRLEVLSPGGFPRGVTIDNVLHQQRPRNRLLAEALVRCGLIERAGQGMNLMFERSIRQSKPVPDFRGTDAHAVRITLHGNVTNPAFLRYLEKVGAQTLASFTTDDLILLDSLQRGEGVPPHLHSRVARLLELGVIELTGRGRGARYLLSRSMYAAIGRGGEYTRRKGLDHETNRQLLLKHLRESPEGSPLAELVQVLPSLGSRSVQGLLRGLRREGLVESRGLRRWARWFTAKDAI